MSDFNKNRFNSESQEWETPDDLSKLRALKAEREGKQEVCVLDMVMKYLDDNDYDGLFSDDSECSCCKNEDDGGLEPCGNMNVVHCIAGWKVPCDDNCSAGGDCDFHISNDSGAKSRRIK